MHTVDSLSATAASRMRAVRVGVVGRSAAQRGFLLDLASVLPVPHLLTGLNFDRCSSVRLLAHGPGVGIDSAVLCE